MIVIASRNGGVGMRAAMEVLEVGGSALDAVEAGIRLVEANPEDHTVGLGGYPNLLGQMELDAAIMDGTTLEVGAVGSVTKSQHPISLARKVLETLPHVFLVGGGADRFAAEMKDEFDGLLTEEVKQVWRERLLQDLSPAELESLADRTDLWQQVARTTDPERAGGTMTMIAQDQEGNICAGVSTSGWAWKYPGRLGDSPIIGAGLYADSQYGAAACTGMGEMTIRACSAHSIVHSLRMGLSLEAAGRQAMEDLNRLGGRFLSRVNLIALNPDGEHIGFSNSQDRHYIALLAGMQEIMELPCNHVPTQQRWDTR